MRLPTAETRWFGRSNDASVLFSFPDSHGGQRARRADIKRAPPRPSRSAERARLASRGKSTRCRWRGPFCRWRGPFCPGQGGFGRPEGSSTHGSFSVLGRRRGVALIHIVKTASLPSPDPQQQNAQALDMPIVVVLDLRVGVRKGFWNGNGCVRCVRTRREENCSERGLHFFSGHPEGQASSWPSPRPFSVTSTCLWGTE